MANMNSSGIVPVPEVPAFTNADHLNPQLWFTMAECKLEACGVTEDYTKYLFIKDKIASLGTKYSTEEELVVGRDMRFHVLKKHFIAITKNIQHQRFWSEKLGGKKPSQFLRTLQELAGTTMSVSGIRARWLSQLPKMLQTVFAVVPEIELEKAGQMADSIFEIMIVAQTSMEKGKKEKKELDNKISEMEESISKLTIMCTNYEKEIAALRAKKTDEKQLKTALHQKDQELKTLHNKYESLNDLYTIYKNTESMDLQHQNDQRKEYEDKLSNLKWELETYKSKTEKMDKKHRDEIYDLRNKYEVKLSKLKQELETANQKPCWYHWKFGDDAENCVKPCPRYDEFYSDDEDEEYQHDGYHYYHYY